MLFASLASLAIHVPFACGWDGHSFFVHHMTTCVAAPFYDRPWLETPTKSSDISRGRSASAEKRGTTKQILHCVLVTFGSVDGHSGPKFSPPLRWIALTSINYGPLLYVGIFKKALWKTLLKLSIGLSSLIPGFSKPCLPYGFQLEIFIYEYEVEHLSGHRRRPRQQPWWMFDSILQCSRKPWQRLSRCPRTNTMFPEVCLSVSPSLL